MPVGLSGVVATWDMEGEGEEDDDADADSHSLAEAVLLKAGLGLEHDDEDDLQVQGEEEEAVLPLNWLMLYQHGLRSACGEGAGAAAPYSPSRHVLEAAAAEPE